MKYDGGTQDGPPTWIGNIQALLEGQKEAQLGGGATTKVTMKVIPEN